MDPVRERTHGVAGFGEVPSASVKYPVTDTDPRHGPTQGQARGPRGPHGSYLLEDGVVTARIRPWPDEPGAVLLVTVDHAVPEPAEITQWMERLSALGIRVVRTGALGPTACPSFLEAGFAVRQELVLLQHPLEGVRSTVIRSDHLLMRRGHTADLPALALIDRRAFGAMWGMDVGGIVDACSATPHHRLRVAARGSVPVGFAVSGRAGRSAYLQRLAVDPDAQGQGVGRDLTLDSLRWARRHRCSSVLVNTHVDNERARTMYEALGFVELAYRLNVLERTLS